MTGNHWLVRYVLWLDRVADVVMPLIAPDPPTLVREEERPKTVGTAVAMAIFYTIMIPFAVFVFVFAATGVVFGLLALLGVVEWHFFYGMGIFAAAWFSIPHLIAKISNPLSQPIVYEEQEYD